MLKRLGWLRQLPDQRDFPYAPMGATVLSLPQKVDLRPGGPPVFDQGDLGSCTANAIATALQFNQLAYQGPNFTPSRLFIYYNERAMRGWEDFDSGAYIRDGFKSIAQQGAAAEGRPGSSGSWEYDISRFRQKPSPQSYNHALNHQAITYYAVAQTPTSIKGALAEELPVVFGFSVYSSFYDVGSDGLVPMPRYTEQLLGGHAVTLVGYDDTTRRYIVQNSWGTHWGDKGFCYMPYDYVHNASLADDFWVVETAELGLGKVGV